METREEIYIKAEKDGTKINMNMSGTIMEMCYMMGELIAEISRGTGTDYEELLELVSETTQTAVAMRAIEKFRRES